MSAPLPANTPAAPSASPATWLGVMVAVIGGIGPFAGSIGFYLDERKIRHQGRAPRPAAEKVS